MTRSTLVIELSPTRLEAAVVRAGKIDRSACIRHELSNWESDWPAAIESLSGVLRDLVTSLNAAGMPAIVLSASPASVTSVHSCIASAGRPAAMSAATLALGNVFGAALDQHPHALVPFFTDAEPQPGGQRMRHILTAAERDDTCESLAQWVESAGARFLGAMPAPAIDALTAARELNAMNEECIIAVCRMGEHQSALAVGSRKSIRFVRPIVLGTEAFVDALTRPIHRQTPGAEPIRLSRDEARSVLERFGIPDPSAAIDPARGIDGKALLPLLQPALQRFAVEIKQSLRFGLSESERNDALLMLSGRGLPIPHLQDILRRLTAPADAEPHACSAQSTRACSTAHGTIEAFLHHRAELPLLLPSRRDQGVTLRRTRSALRVGIAAALVLVGVEGAATWLEHATLQQQTLPATQAEASAAISGSIAAAREKQRGLESLLRTHLGGDAPLAPWLSAVATAAVNRVHLSSIETKRAETGCLATIRGITLAAAPNSPDPLRQFISEVEACPVVNKLNLSHAQRSQGETENVQEFEIELHFVDLPHVVLQQARAEEPSP